MRITDESHEIILDEILRRERVGHNPPAGHLWLLMKIQRVMKVMKSSWKFV